MITALIVDDSGVIRQQLRQLINAAVPNCKIYECDNALEAARFLMKAIPQAIFLDLNMPGVSGMSFLSKLDTILAGQKPPAIISISSDISQSTLAGLQKWGAYDILPKPFTLQSVASVLLKVLQLARKSSALIIDDSATVRRVVSRVITRSRFNIEVIEAEDGQMGVHLASQQPHDVIFIDLNMPGIDGVEAGGMILYERPEANIVLMSGENNDRALREASHIGIKYFLKKPFYSDDVDGILHGIFEIKDSAFVQAKDELGFEDAVADLIWTEKGTYQLN